MNGSPHTVSDVMTRAVVAVGRDTPFKDVVRLIEEWQVSALPVLEGEGRVVGVVSEADLLLKEEFRDSDPDRFTQLRRLSDLARAGALTAGELMSTPAVTVHADATLAQAARVMAQLRLKRLPVVDAEGLLKGVVSRVDLLKVFLPRSGRARRRGPRRSGTCPGCTCPARPRPRPGPRGTAGPCTA
ncbi:CBS domain-containing protein [Streptomyces sp. NPDC020731]|uniref:CBS domain-containing protein n=1 Tax=Streptomyces sp. NPDC020731 TaxID=3365085 RepID=UPI0037B56112